MLRIPRAPGSTLFPYTTLFRSRNDSNAKGQTMNAEQAQESETRRNAETPNGAIDESGKVDRIREILFGSQMRDYDGRFQRDRKSTRLNSSHRTISYAVFCLKKK